MADFITWDCELTDTFGGEANYSWVRREVITLPAGASDLAVVRAAKRALSLSGTHCRRYELGEGFELRPYASCTVAFIIPRY